MVHSSISRISDQEKKRGEIYHFVLLNNHKMKKTLKQVLGVDVDQKNLVVTLGRLTEDLTVELYAHRVFANNKKGFPPLLKWIGSLTDCSVPFQIVMEATGVYHEKFAYFLDEKGYALSV